MKVNCKALNNFLFSFIKQKYKLCTKEYLSEGKDGYDVFKNCPVKVNERWGLSKVDCWKSTDCKMITFNWSRVNSSLKITANALYGCSLSLSLCTFSVSPYYIITLNFLSLFYFHDLQETAEQCCTLSTGVRNHFESIQIIKGYKKCKSGHRQSLVSLVRYVYHHHHQSPS